VGAGCHRREKIMGVDAGNDRICGGYPFVRVL
jgi:hypothetical protein